jgi:serine/threonine-protein kinase RsbW
MSSTKRKEERAIKVRSQLDSLIVIRDFVDRVAGHFGLDEELVFALQLAVDEACTNIIVHGYQEREGDIELSFRRQDDEIVVTIKDRAPPFDPEAVPLPPLDAPLEDRPLGGLGMYLMHQVMDEVRFDFDEERGNELTMIKRLK